LGPLDDDAALSALLPPRGVTTPSPPEAKKKPRTKRQAPKKDPSKPQTADEVFGFCPKVDRDRLLVELARVAFSDITKTFGPDNLPLPPSEIPHVCGRAIASMTVRKTTRRMIGKGEDAVEETVQIIGVTLAPKLVAIDLLAKRLGMYAPRVPPEVSVVLSLPTPTSEAG
jgi:hypothetical protein